MAPEVFRHEPYNSRVDVYSYSMIVYQLFEVRAACCAVRCAVARCAVLWRCAAPGRCAVPGRCAAPGRCALVRCTEPWRCAVQIMQHRSRRPLCAAGPGSGRGGAGRGGAVERSLGVAGCSVASAALPAPHSPAHTQSALAAAAAAPPRRRRSSSRPLPGLTPWRRRGRRRCTSGGPTLSASCSRTRRRRCGGARPP